VVALAVQNDQEAPTPLKVLQTSPDELVHDGSVVLEYHHFSGMVSYYLVGDYKAVED